MIRIITFALMISTLFVALSCSAIRSSSSSDLTSDDPETFIKEAEAAFLDAAIKDSRSSWVQTNFITYDTEQMAANTRDELARVIKKYAEASRKFDGRTIPDDVKRKISLLKLSVSAPAPSDLNEAKELSDLGVKMESLYGKGKYCPKGDKEKCYSLGDLETILATSRNPEELKMAWTGWRTVSPQYRKDYERFVVLANKGAQELGFKDLGAMWRSNYDMEPEQFAAEMERLWQQVKPLYDSLHTYVRGKLREKYGPTRVPASGPIPADLLGNMWSQQWGNIYDIVKPASVPSTYDLTKILVARKTTPEQMVKYGEGFFTSIGFKPLPPTFWERSLFTKPADRDVVCHASAWNLDFKDDLRIKMCIKITEDEFVTIHHELGHNFYQRAASVQSPLYSGGANDGFHEAIGDVIALSTTPEYLKRLNLISNVPDQKADIALLLRQALDKVAFLPFGYLVDQWRWKVFSGEIKPADYNKAWWELCEKYQGIAPPSSRSEADFDPGAKYHVPANTPYARYFLARILQFQFHRSMCKDAGFKGPLNRCSVYGNKEVGAKLEKMLAMGQSRPWPEALKALTGEDKMDATAIIDYFAPLKVWLDEENKKMNGTNLK